MKKRTIEDLKNAIEEKLAWGPAGKWTNYDFERLSDEIRVHTSVSLSVSTLKRFFGKTKYGSTPSVTTLNTLSAFMAFRDWRDFEGAVDRREEIPGPVDSISERQATTRPPSRYAAFVLAGAFVLLGAVAMLNSTSNPAYNAADFSFSSKTVLTSGLPNSVIFDYDASRVRPDDTVFICQTWDTRRKTAVDRNAAHYSSMYYYPGYFRAKLMAGDQVLQEHDIQITTDGWLGLVTAPWGVSPLYFSPDEILKDSVVEISTGLLGKYKVDLFPDLPEIRVYNQKDLRGFVTDNFEFETEVKSGFSAGKSACQRVNIYLQAKDDILFLPLVLPACVGDLFVAAYGTGVGSNTEDLSGFGCNLNEWINVRVVCKDRHVLFFVNERLALETDIQNPVNEIVGVQYRFEGPGSVRNTRLTSGDQVCVFL